MGVWGTGIFQDDTASDIREEYRDHVGNGSSGPEATARILKNHAQVSDPDESRVVWLALAATQWKLGRLEDEILQRALEVIDSGSDLKRWEGAGSKDYLARKEELEKLRAQISSPQPSAKKVARRTLSECDWKVGELISLKLQSGRIVILRVIGRHTDRGGTYPECELLDWTGEVVPSRDILAKLAIRKSRADYKHTITQLMICGIGKRAAPRIQNIGVRLRPEQKTGRCSVVHWRYLDKFLKEWFLLE